MKAILARLGRDTDHEVGFSLIEIIISMFLLALLAMAFLPLLVQGLKQSASNATLATATQLVNGQIELSRSQTTCSTLVATSATVVDPRGVSLLVARTVGTCAPTAENPASVPVSVSVTRADTGVVVASASTRVFVVGP